MFLPAKLIPLDRLKFLVKDTVIFGLAQGLSRSFALITFPILSRNLSVSEYGVLDLFLTISGFVTIFLIFGQDSAVARLIYDTKSIKFRKQIISQSLQIQIILSVTILPILALINSSIEQIFEINNFSLYLNIILITIPCMVLINFSQNILKWTFDRNKFLFLTVGFSFSQALFLSITVYFLNFDIITALIINLTSNIIFSILGILFIRKWITFKFEKFYKKELILFAIPIGLACIIESFMPVIERQLILKYLSLHNLGIYAAATKIAMIISLLIGAFQICWDPMALSIFKEKNASKTYNQVSKIFCILICMAVLFIDLVSTKIIIILASERYLEASILVFPVCMAFAIKSLGGITNIGISLSKKTQFYLISYLCSIIAFFMSFLYLIPQYGILAIAFSFLISQIIKAIISTFLAQLLYPIKWDYKPLIIITSLTLIFGLFTNYAKIDNEHRVLSIIVFMFFMFIYFVLSLRKILKNEVEN